MTSSSPIAEPANRSKRHVFDAVFYLSMLDVFFWCHFRSSSGATPAFLLVPLQLFFWCHCSFFSGATSALLLVSLQLFSLQNA
jgi:hypothetical protein